jgi:hypothetical protein
MNNEFSADEKIPFAHLNEDGIPVLLLLSYGNDGNAKEIGARLNMIESMTGRSRPDFKPPELP